MKHILPIFLLILPTLATAQSHYHTQAKAWFDQVGGGHQFLILREEYTGKSLEEISNAVDNGAKIENYFYTVRDMIGLKWIEEIK